MRSGMAGYSQSIDAHLSKSEDSMAQKTNFTADEWKTVLASPMLAGMAVTLSEPSGLWGMMKEGMASGQALLDVKRDPGASELAKLWRRRWKHRWDEALPVTR